MSGTNTGDQDLSTMALKTNVLELDNAEAFTPDADYEPATKKYVDDNAVESDPLYSESQAANITAGDITNLGNLSGTNTGDQDLSAMALKSNVLELDNTASFIPDADYEPATKKYVDSLIARLDSLIGLVSPPVAAFSADVKTIMRDGTVNFTDESTKTPTSWSWDFGDGSAESMEQNPSHIYDTEGTYTVTLTATNDHGSDDEEKTDYITVNPPPPVANFSANETTIYIDGAVNFTDESTNTPTSWSWNFGDGSAVSTEQNPSHIYNSLGTYTVTLTATNISGSDDEEKTDYITVIEVGTVMNPTTGKTWMDRNLGASQVATSLNDVAAYGDLYQWGRASDGHEKRTSLTTTTNATTAVPDAGNSWDGLFIIEPDNPYDWLTPKDDNLWQGVSGTNNPCPSGFRIPTEAEWASERSTWSSQNSAGAFSSLLKLTCGGYRIHSDASFAHVGNQGIYWSSNVQDYWGRALAFGSSTAGEAVIERAKASSVRCIKEE